MGYFLRGEEREEEEVYLYGKKKKYYEDLDYWDLLGNAGVSGWGE